MPGQNVGQPLWIDLTVEDATKVRDFYKAVIGWDSQDVDMGGYADYMMEAPDAAPDKPSAPPYHVAGVCHARGGNADLPPQWLIYFGVADLDASLIAVEKHGGEAVSKVKSMGASRYCVIRDPAGAVCALYENNPAAG